MVDALIEMQTDESVAHVPSLVDPRTRYKQQVVLPNQSFPGLHRNWNPPLNSGEESYVGTGRLKGRKALITGGGSGIGRAVAIAFACEGADVTINYLPEEQPDADEVRAVVEAEGVRFFAMPGDLRNDTFCADLCPPGPRRDGRARHPGQQRRLLGAASEHCQPHDRADSAHLRGQRLRVLLLGSRRGAAPPARVLHHFHVVGHGPSAARSGRRLRGDEGCPGLHGTDAGLAARPSGIRVNAVAPGPTATNFLTSHGLTNENATTVAAQLPLGRIAQPAEPAPIYVMIAEGSNSQALASTYGVNGGNLAF
jgi:NAD(P)-dependent dehydrogenase (short-subunit alcohol dehydrogenase family)